MSRVYPSNLLGFYRYTKEVFAHQLYCFLLPNFAWTCSTQFLQSQKCNPSGIARLRMTVHQASFYIFHVLSQATFLPSREQGYIFVKCIALLRAVFWSGQKIAVLSSSRQKKVCRKKSNYKMVHKQIAPPCVTIATNCQAVT